MNIQIRTALQKENPLLVSLIRRGFKDVAEKFNLTQENCPTHSFFISEEKIQREFVKGVEFFILKCYNNDCGCVSLEYAKPGVCYLKRLAVLPEFRNKGMGKKLVSHCFKEVKEHGYSRIEIGIIAEQKDLQRWYEKRGFIHDRQVQFKHLLFLSTLCLLIWIDD